MLYDNAQLISVYVEAHQATGQARFEEVAREVADYVIHEMTQPGGGFHSATDADSEGEEGKFFVWSERELDELLDGEDRALFKAFYGVTAGGNFEGHNILFRSMSSADFARATGVDEGRLKAVLRSARSVLYDARKKRVPPLLDDKVLVEWNGQMIGAMARLAWLTGEARYLGAATRAAEFIEDELVAGGRLQRSWRDGRAAHAAVLEDYAFYIEGLLDLFETSGEPRWLKAALHHQQAVDTYFWDPEHGGILRDCLRRRGAPRAGQAELR
ncbi:MAG: thioredoxin domain-containing protein, partial [Myxococcales bacterium]|nr:thioredoxin domain-containing protein [Myxococcales bacterium]